MIQNDSIYPIGNTIEEDIKILSTRYIPMGEEADAIKVRCERRKAEIDRLQSRINDLNTACNVANSLISPIRKIPRDILAMILVKTIPPLPSAEDIKNPNSHVRFVTPQAVRSRLELVCRTWHAIVQETPGLWSTIFVDPPILSLTPVNRLNEYMARAHNVPINLALIINDPSTYDNRMDTIDQVTHIVNTNKPHFSELTMIHQSISENGIFLWEDGISPWSTLLGEFPGLKHLHVESAGRIPILVRDNDGPMSIHMPCLTDLTLLNGAFYIFLHMTSPTLHNLRTIKISGEITNAIYLPYFAHCIRLQYLNWGDDGGSHYYTQDNSASPTTLPSLQTLILETHNSYSHNFFSNLDLPVIHHIEVTYTENKSIPKSDTSVHKENPINVLIRAPTPSLRTLIIVGIALSHEGYFTILDYLPNLEKLHITDNDLDLKTPFFQWLSTPDSNLCFQLPQLKLLKLRVKGLDEAALTDLIQRRTRADGDADDAVNGSFIKYIDVYIGGGYRHEPLMHLIETRNRSVRFEGDFWDDYNYECYCCCDSPEPSTQFAYYDEADL